MASTQPTSAARKVSWTRTKFGIEEAQHTWTILNFNLCQKDNGEGMESAVSRTNDERAWTLELYPKGRSDKEKDYVSLYLRICSSVDPSAAPEVKFKFRLLNAKQEAINNLNYTRSSLCYKYEVQEGYGWPKFVKRDHLIEFLQDNPLIISCELTICGDRIDTLGQSSILPIPACTLSHDLGSLFRDPTAGDTIIEVDGKEFFVYRGFLQARSPVFTAMFQHKMKEQIQNRVIITDFEPRVVEEMLTYIYTGKSPNIQAMAGGLLSIADKYSLERLKMMPANVLSRELKNGNAIETLILADIHTMDDLKKFVINFIATNRSYFINDEVWENIVLSLSSKHPNLIVEVTRALFTTRK